MEDIYQGLGHIAVCTENMEESIAFYEKLGGRLLKRDYLEKPEGMLDLALVELGGVTVELLRYPYPVHMGWGSIPHFALYVSDVDEAARRIRAAGVDSFTAPEKNDDPRLFGGLENWFFTGPSGELIELLKMKG